MVSDLFNMLMYADDTTLYCNLDDTHNDEVINAELVHICDWLAANKLSLNIKKTKFMVFHSTNKKVTFPILKIYGKEIDRVTFLGSLYNQTCHHHGINILLILVTRYPGLLILFTD